MRSEAWRPAAAACNRLPREAREVARQALRPSCEELAVRIRVMPETEARPRVKNRHGGAPRGERPTPRDARRLARRLACRVMCTPNGCRCTRTFLGAPPTPRFGASEARLQTPGAEMRRGNDGGCVVHGVARARSRECGRHYCALSPCGRGRLDVAARHDR